jgi:hypothetical protein
MSQTTDLAQAKPRDPLMMVEDTSQYSMLLDTRKFDQMWRAACLFSKTQLVPQQYQGHAEDCFVGMQMAMRLGVDPLMFMQASYVVHGRPGMEAKFVIALINSSGLFGGPLQFEINGNGDDKGCYAYTTWKATGEKITGPRVDMKMAKAEGWTKNSKWQTLTDLMLRYRAAAFFGRTVCPERLMGMQTVEELEEMPEPKRITARVTDAAKSITAKLDKQPANVPDNVDTSTAQEAPPVEESHAPAPAEEPKEEGQQQAPQIQNFEGFRLAAFNLMADTHAMTEAQLGKWIDTQVRALNKTGNEASISPATLARWFAELAAMPAK